MSKNNKIKNFDIILRRSERNEEVFLTKGRVSARLHVIPTNFEIARYPVTEIKVLRSLDTCELSKLKTRIQQHTKYVLTNVAYEYLNKSKELKLLNCLFEDVAYINYLRNLHWIEIIEHIYFNRKTEKDVHKNMISKVKDITANLVKDNDILLDKSLWAIEDSYQQKLVDLDVKMMRLKLKLFLSQANLAAQPAADTTAETEDAKKKHKENIKRVNAIQLEIENTTSPLITDKMQIEALTKIDINKIDFQNAYAIYKFLQVQSLDHQNETPLKKWDKRAVIQTLQSQIREKFRAYNPQELANNLNAKYDTIKAQFDQELELGKERLKNQALITKEQINEYEKHNLTREEDFYWWKYAEIYKCASAKLNRNIGLQNLYVKNLFWKIQEHNSSANKEIEFSKIPGLLQPLKFASEVKLNLSNFDNKIKLSNEKHANDPTLGIEIYNQKCDVEELDTLFILSKFKNVKNFQVRTALLRELAQLKYEKATRSNKIRYENLKEALKLDSETRVKALNRAFADEMAVSELLQIRQEQEAQKAAEAKIEAEKK